MPASPSETHHGERCCNPRCPLSDHPARTVVLLALRYEGSEHRESGDPSLDLTSLAATLSTLVLLSPLDCGVRSKRRTKAFTTTKKGNSSREEGGYRFPRRPVRQPKPWLSTSRAL